MKTKFVNPLERARWDAFFMLDRLQNGGAVRKKIDENRYAFSHGTSLQDNERRIREMIRHAVSTTDYYKAFDPEAPLSSFPIVTKEDYRAEYDRFRSKDYIDAKDNRVMYTSGSTGTPFGMVQDHAKILSDRADGIFLGTVGGYHIGEKMGFIRIWVEGNMKTRLEMLMENSLMLDTTRLDPAGLEDLLREIRQKRVKCIISYASALIAISKYIAETDYDMSGFSVRSIIPISEYMPPEVRRRLAAQFGCSVRAWYSNEENGIMGIQCKNSDAYHINTESYYYEILKFDSDEPAEDGELGRIVITDLTNRAFPIIRYDNGDSAVAKHVEKDGRYSLYLTEVYGRRSDILYDTAGKAVSPYVIYFNLWEVPNVKQYRFLQKTVNEYELQLNADPDQIDAQAIVDNIRPSFGDDAEIAVTFVDEIPVLASGKRKYIENLCEVYH